MTVYPAGISNIASGMEAVETEMTSVVEVSISFVIAAAADCRGPFRSQRDVSRDRCRDGHTHQGRPEETNDSQRESSC